MFSKLPELFDRNFATGYFLPVASFIAATLEIANKFGLLPVVQAASQTDILLGTTLIGLISWIGGICLLAANRDILRLAEGYGRFNPANMFKWRERRRYRKLREELSRLDEECLPYISNQQELPSKLRLKRNSLMQEAVERFPDEEHWLLPTPLGNAIRAFEIYPLVMYGLESIQGWNRLLAVVPEAFRELVDNAKAHVDFWVNLWLLSLVFTLEYGAVALYTRKIEALWIPFLSLGVALIAFSRATSAAVGWGNWVKATFDTFLPELYDKLGFSCPPIMEQERALWRKFSQAIIYREADLVPNRSGLRLERKQNAITALSSRRRIAKKSRPGQRQV